jgi:hypothetical protein
MSFVQKCEEFIAASSIILIPVLFMLVSELF